MRFTAGAGVRLARQGIDAGNLAAESAKWRAAGRSIEFMFALLASMLGEYQDGKWVSVGLTAEQLADQFSAAEIEAISAAVIQSVKPQPAASTAETTPAAETPQQPN
jgi:hypothetical protein